MSEQVGWGEAVAGDLAQQAMCGQVVPGCSLDERPTHQFSSCPFELEHCGRHRICHRIVSRHPCWAQEGKHEQQPAAQGGEFAGVEQHCLVHNLLVELVQVVLEQLLSGKASQILEIRGHLRAVGTERSGVCERQRKVAQRIGHQIRITGRASGSVAEVFDRGRPVERIQRQYRPKSGQGLAASRRNDLDTRPEFHASEELFVLDVVENEQGFGVKRREAELALVGLIIDFGAGDSPPCRRRKSGQLRNQVGVGVEPPHQIEAVLQERNCFRCEL